MHASRSGTAAVFLFLSGIPWSPLPAAAETRPMEVGGFIVEQEVVVRGTPEAVFDLFTGDVKPWWDHHFSEDPVELRIEPYPGGRFLERFDHQGNGTEHARVITADRGKLLRFDGPLGFSGHALRMVHTFTFEDAGEGRTRIEVSVHGTGEMEEAWPEAVDRVWHHFLVEAFKPYADAQPTRPRSRRN